MESINERIAKLFKEKEVKNALLAEKLGVTPQSISQWKTNGSIGLEVVKKLLAEFNDLNSNWLITGTGEMFLTPLFAFEI